MLALVQSLATWLVCRSTKAAQKLPTLFLVRESNAHAFRTGRFTILILTVVAAILRIVFLDSKSFWFDEGATAQRAVLPLVALLKVIASGRTNMSFYYLLLHGWVSLAGSSEFALRLPSALFSAATVPLV